ncbi:MAG: hypothetical protein R2838_02575 [Caldilineaceae bacterium]
MVEDLEAAGCGGEVDALAADDGRGIPAIVERELGRDGGQRLFDHVAGEKHAFAGIIQGQAGRQQTRAQVWSAHLNPDLGQDAKRFGENLVDQRGGENL